MPNTPKPVDEPVKPVDELGRLRRENAELRRQLAEANARLTPTKRPKPERPSFGLSEGERADIEMNGQTTSPFTGERLDEDDL